MPSMRGPVGAAATLLLLLGCLLPGRQRSAAAQEVPPERAHWVAHGPFPAAKLLLDVRDELARHPEQGAALVSGRGCTSLDGPRCTQAQKQRLLETFPASLATEKASTGTGERALRDGHATFACPRASWRML